MDDTPTGTGQVINNHTIQQSVEFGGRITSLSGSEPMYGTQVNQRSGLRLFQQSLVAQPVRGTNGLFDNLYLESFGWGGDPSNAARLRVSKRREFDFSVSFRRDQNYFNYDLLANPLNPASTTSLPTITVNDSPHRMYLRRRMYDLNLTLLPQRKLSFFAGYSRDRNAGPSFSSVHVGIVGSAEALLMQNSSTTQNSVRLGASWRALRRTTLTFAESLQYIKNDTDQALAPFNTIAAADGTPIEFGLSWLGASPCDQPIAGGYANPSCNAYLTYSRAQRYRNTIPTEQINLTSNSIKQIEFTARFLYSSADAHTPLNESFNGLDIISGVRSLNTRGTTASARWVSDEAETGLTVHLGSHWRLVDSFRFYSFRVPGAVNFMQNNLYNLASVAAPNVLQPVAVFPAAPFHSSSSLPDVQNDLYNRFIQQTTKSNEFSIHFDLSRNFGAHVGYLYRNIFDAHHWISTAIGDIYYPDPSGTAIANCQGAGGAVNPDGTCTVTGEFDSENEPITIQQHWAIAGVWYRIRNKLRADAEVRLMSADNYLTRIDPRHERQFRANVAYTPNRWLTVAGNLNLREQRNPTQDFGYNAHYTNAGLNVMAASNRRLTVAATYLFANSGENGNLCYLSSTPVAGSYPCVNDNTRPEVLGNYSNHTHYGSANVLVRPVRRVSGTLGYSVVAVDGSELILNVLQPLGPLASRYYRPLASLAVELSHQLELRGGWNYYQYSENSFVGPTAPRYFHANLTNISMKYFF